MDHLSTRRKEWGRMWGVREGERKLNKKEIKAKKKKKLG